MLDGYSLRRTDKPTRIGITLATRGVGLVSTTLARTVHDEASRRQGICLQTGILVFSATTAALGLGRAETINLIFPLMVLFAVNTLIYTHLIVFLGLYLILLITNVSHRLYRSWVAKQKRLVKV